MKLYTEEQVKKAFIDGIKYASILHPASILEYDKYVKNVINSLTPIELPSDEEIEARARGFTDYPYGQAGFIRGTQYMKEQILKQNQ